MTDQEKVRRCAELMGIKLEPGMEYEYFDSEGSLRSYCPLHDKAQALDLVIKLKMDIDSPTEDGGRYEVSHWNGIGKEQTVADSTDLLRAIVECAAKVGG